MKTYIFDLDGTLLDSMRIWEQIDIDFLTARNITVPPDYIAAVSSLSFPEAAEYTIRRFCLPDSAAGLMQEWNRMAVYAYGHTVELKPFAREYLISLLARGAQMGIATSLPAALYEPVLSNHDLTDFFTVICSTDEVGCGKSKPDIFLHTAVKMGAAPKDCIVFEDILAAVQSAKLAGMTVYGVWDESSREQWPMIQKTADGVLYNFKDAPLPG